MNSQTVGSIEKQTFQASILDPATGQALPIEDGFVASTWTSEGQLLDLGGRGARLPSEFNLEPLPFTQDEAMQLARAAAPAIFEKRGPRISEFALANFDQAFTDATIHQTHVVLDGERATKIITSLGEFIVKADRTVSVAKFGTLN